MNLALNPFDKGKKPEKVSRVDVDTHLQELSRELRLMIADYGIPMYRLGYDKFEEKYEELFADMMNVVGDISKNDLEQLICLLWSGEMPYAPAISPLPEMISRLIQHSFDIGYNDFHIIAPRPVSLVGNMLKGTPGSYLKLSVYGDVGEYFGRFTEFCDLVVYGEGDSCLGNYAKSSKFKVKDVSFFFAANATDCEFELDTVLMKPAAYTSYDWPRCCVFKVHDKNSFDFLYERWHKGNKVIRV
ncbi:hypothetical protein KY330_05805 [Candidatus Woesearchaeota archaeon]|nr:hypothetical protein [Candidatus Woesearchaeota archaeon]